jgi:hypothetical protein
MAFAVGVSSVSASSVTTPKSKRMRMENLLLGVGARLHRMNRAARPSADANFHYL